MRINIIITFITLTYFQMPAQSVTVSNDGSSPHASAMLEIKSTSKGMLIPRMTQSERNLISAPATGLLIFQTDNTQGFYFFNGSTWTSISATSAPAWLLSGNNGSDPSTDFIGTSDTQPLRFRVNNIWAGELHPSSGNSSFGLQSGMSHTSAYDNSSFGTNALSSNSAGYDNTAIGKSALYTNTTGDYNTAVGKEALYSNANGNSNTAIGWQSLYSNNAYNNTAIGALALKLNTVGHDNTANGYNALSSNGVGFFNTAMGSFALQSNTTGDHNTAIGLGALQYNSAGRENTAIGSGALTSNLANYNTSVGYTALAINTSGEDNTATGHRALYTNSTGFSNTAVGSQALTNNTSSSNTAVGKSALQMNSSGSYNTAVGEKSSENNTTGFENVAIGAWALRYNTTGYDNVAIGSDVLLNNVDGDYNISIGKASGTITSYNYTVSIGNHGYLNGGNNQVFLGNLSSIWNGGNVGWSTFSDARVKRMISEDVKGLDFITRLKPVTYYRDIELQTQLTGNQPTEDYPSKYAIEQIKFSGFLAQEVEQAALESGYDFSGITKPKNEHDLYTLSYESFVVPLVKAVQEQQQIIESQNQKIISLEERLTGFEAKAKAKE